RCTASRRCLEGLRGTMKILLDTHVFLWYLTSDSRLPQSFESAIQDLNNDVYLSVASVWEAVIKHQIGKLPLPASADAYVSLQRAAHGIASLPIDEGAMAYLAQLPLLHRDPFDRLLVAQASQHGLTVATVDPAVKAYTVPTLAES
ncbi:MAG: type II toxin-antitoxin system VapC family toxin, partial [Pirellulales bacterium]